MGGRQRKKVLKTNIDFCFLRFPKLHHALLPCLFQSLVVAAGPSWPCLFQSLVPGAGSSWPCLFQSLVLGSGASWPCPLKREAQRLESATHQPREKVMKKGGWRESDEEDGWRDREREREREGERQERQRRHSTQHQKLEEAGPRRPSTKDCKRQVHEDPAPGTAETGRGRATTAPRR